jgi:hypothetical protein
MKEEGIKKIEEEKQAIEMSAKRSAIRSESQIGEGGSRKTVEQQLADSPEDHLRENKLEGEEILIAEYVKDPNKQIELTQSGEEKILCSLARNKNLHPKAQRILCESKDWLVKGFLAGNPKNTPEVQKRLADTGGEIVIERLLSKGTRQILETPRYSLQQSKQDAIHAQRQGDAKSQGISK